MLSIKEARESKGLSQVEIAKRLGTDVQNYHRLEKREKKLSIEQLENICNAIGVSMLYILSDDIDRNLEDKNYQFEIMQNQLKEEMTKMEERMESAKKVVSNLKFMIDKGLKIDEEYKNSSEWKEL